MRRIKLFEEHGEYTNKMRARELRFASGRSRKEKDMSFLRNEVGIYKGDDVVSKATDTEVRKMAAELIDRWKKDDVSSKSYMSIVKSLQSLIDAKNLRIDVMGDYVPNDLKVKFALPALLNTDYNTRDSGRTHMEVDKFLAGAEEVTIKVTSRDVKDKWCVVYDGKITNDRGETLEFENVCNGVARTLG